MRSGPRPHSDVSYSSCSLPVSRPVAGPASPYDSPWWPGEESRLLTASPRRREVPSPGGLEKSHHTAGTCHKALLSCQGAVLPCGPTPGGGSSLFPQRCLRLPVLSELVELFKNRRRQAELEAREAAGESFWTREFDEAARNKIVLAMWDMDRPWANVTNDTPLENAKRLVARQFGWHQLEGVTGRGALSQIVQKEPDGEIVASIIEAVAWALANTRFVAGSWEMAARFEERINHVCSTHRIAYELIEGEMVPFDSKEMHEAVVAPTLRLLSGRSGWEHVEAAYQDALREIGEGNAADAITDAGRALQAALEVAGARGNALGPLVKDAKKKGLLGNHDETLTDGIGKFMDWVSAERSEMGEAHKSGTDERADAWLAVHIVGALVLRLAEGPRG